MATAALLILISPLLVVTSIFCIEVVAGLAPSRRPKALDSRPSAVIVVPAHDEAAIIERTLGELKSASGSEMRILVVADNCSDETATRARDTGVEVVERTDPVRPGKGYALAFAVEQLKASEPEVLVVMDADCSIDHDSLGALVSAAGQSGRPCQAVNLLRPDRTAEPLVQISAFAFMIKNLVRQQGLERLSGRVHLTGTGMAIPFQLLSTSLLASSDIVEDLGLGLEMSERGHPPMLIPNAIVLSGAAAASETLLQRRRWEGGYLATAIRRGPKSVAKAIHELDGRLLLAALDLMVPPLALLAVLNLMALAVLTGVVATLGASWTPVAAHALLLIVACLLVLAAWWLRGRDFVSAAVLAAIPIYIAWKIPFYLSLARHGAPREWLRTGR